MYPSLVRHKRHSQSSPSLVKVKMLPMYFLFSLASASGCPPSVIIAASDTAKVELSPGQYADAVLVIQHPVWTSMEGANWVWANTDCQPSAANNWVWPACPTSTSKFMSTFTLPSGCETGWFPWR